jgi:hypothetical protein
MKTLLLALIVLIGLLFVGIPATRFFMAPTPTIWSSGPTIEHIESLSQLVCLRVHIADVLVGENDDYRGSWLIKGDALLAIDLKQAKIVECNPAVRRARVRLPEPTVTSPRVDHERSRTWSVERLTWIPWRGNPDGLRDEAMKRAQRVIDKAASSKENVQTAKMSAEKIIQEMYRMVGWEVELEWSAAAK